MKVPDKARCCRGEATRRVAVLETFYAIVLNRRASGKLPGDPRERTDTLPYGARLDESVLISTTGVAHLIRVRCAQGKLVREKVFGHNSMKFSALGPTVKDRNAGMVSKRF